MSATINVSINNINITPTSYSENSIEYWLYSFTDTNYIYNLTFDNVSQPIPLSVLIVAGGGSGGNTNNNTVEIDGGGGGGGGGGVGQGILSVNVSTTITISVGKGSTLQTIGTFGGRQCNSTIQDIIYNSINETAYGGGEGGGYNNGSNGGSGGGVWFGNVKPYNKFATKGNGTLLYYGNNGSSAISNYEVGYDGGGGGGAGQAISNTPNGGNGIQPSVVGIPKVINGNAVYYGGGGGGGTYSDIVKSYNGLINIGGYGGGGYGYNLSGFSVNATPNTGGGGGGGSPHGGNNGSGGSGIVQIAIPKSYVNIYYPIQANIKITSETDYITPVSYNYLGVDFWVFYFKDNISPYDISFTNVSQKIPIFTLIIGGGGGGGITDPITGNGGGGGGGGGVGQGVLYVYDSTNLSVSIGNGTCYDDGQSGNFIGSGSGIGNTYIVDTITGNIFETAYGGGLGSGQGSVQDIGQGVIANDINGGSSGGKTLDNINVIGLSATSGSGSLTYSGNNGGQNNAPGPAGGSGGGGAISSGGIVSTNISPAGSGGTGIQPSVFGIPNTNNGVPIYYAGGGGGGSGISGTLGVGGSGGGGNGGASAFPGKNGIPNTGGGGGGCGAGSTIGSVGGSGMVVLSIPKYYINIL